jgi:hypothetical protein
MCRCSTVVRGMRTCVQAKVAAAEQARRCSEEELQQLRDATVADRAASTTKLAEAADVIQQLQQEARPRFCCCCWTTCMLDRLPACFANASFKELPLSSL